MTYLPAKTTPSLCFGEICTSDFLRDVYVRADCVRLQKTQLSKRQSEHHGSSELMPAWVAVPPARAQDLRWSLAHGDHWEEYVVLSDDCLSEKYSRFDSGRLLFAPLRPRRIGHDPDPENIDDITNFDSCPLARDAVFGEDRVVVLSNAFAVDVQDLNQEMQRQPSSIARVRSLDGSATASLLKRWTAHASRTGPIVSYDNIGKLERLLDHRGIPTQLQDAIFDSLAALADVMWQCEVEAFEVFSDV